MSELTMLDRPLYTASLAAEYLAIRKSTLRYWLDGAIRADATYEPVVRTAADSPRDLTWGEFVECWYVRQYRKVHRVPMSDIRRLIAGLRGELGIAYPLAHQRAFVAAGRHLALRVQDEAALQPESWLVVTTPDGQLGLSGIAESFLDEVVFEAGGLGVAAAIRPDGIASPVVIRPEIAFGAPTIGGIRTENLADLIAAGEPSETVLADFQISEADLDAALAYERRRSEMLAA